MSNYITEAFKKFDLLESEDISLNAAGIEELRSFMDEAGVDPDEEEIEIYDLGAQAEDELKQSYLGKAILECKVCHSYIFEDRENIGTDVEGNCCTDIECPYCLSTDGFIVIGEVAPYNESESEELIAAQHDEDLPIVDVEGGADDIDDEDIIEESLDESQNFDRKGEYVFKKNSDTPVGRFHSSDGSYSSFDGTEIPEDEKKELMSEDMDEGLEKGIKEIGVDALKAGAKAAADSVKSDVLGESCESEEDLDEGVSGAIAGGVVGSLVGHPIAGASVGSALQDTFDENLEEGMKLDGVKELYDNDEIRGVEEIEGDDKLEGNDEIRGDKHKDPINEECEDKMDESCDSEKLEEAIEDMSVTTEDETMTMTTKEDGGVVIETSPKEDEMEFSGEEMVVPMSDESEMEVEAAVDANSVEDGEEDEDFASIEDEMAEDEFAIDDFDDFDEESFNGLGESYLKSCYENVTGFKTTGVSTKGNKLFIEGVIKFDSGNIKETNFVFESVGDNKFEGYNKQISRGNKTFKLTGSMNGKKLVCESLNYNYRSKNELNESVRVYGTVKRK